jgi:uridine kinase
MTSYIIGIAGGTSSGKTTVSKAISDKLGVENISYLNYDNYYLDQSHLDITDRAKINYDHPSSLDTDQLIYDLKQLIMGKVVEIPIYDFITHTRLKTTQKVYPKKIILVEGILTLTNIVLGALFSLKIFVDTEADERFIRRLTRDIKERGRTVTQIVNQYQNTVKPMHQKFIEPYKSTADIIIPSGYNKAAVDLVTNSLFQKINNCINY